MYYYTMTQWILFFFWYCFLGWIWECSFVSLTRAYHDQKLEFVNRGFLQGPLIPIYGFAAIAILLATIPVKDHTIAVYIIGAVTATLFELITGAVMEKLFQVKYWDYGNLPLNYNGYICLFVSLFWGFFSILLVQVIHVPAERVILQAPASLCDHIVLLLLAIFVCDLVTSFHQAMDLRDVLESWSKNTDTLNRLEKRFHILAALTPAPDPDEPQGLALTAKERMIRNIERLRRTNEAHLNRIKEHIQLLEFEHLSDRKELLEKLELDRKRIVAKSNKQILCAINQLKRNPNARSAKYQDAVNSLKELLKKHH